MRYFSSYLSFVLPLFLGLALGFSDSSFSATQSKKTKSSQKRSSPKSTPTPTPSPSPTPEDDEGPTPTPAPTAVPSPYVDQWTSVLDIGYNLSAKVEQSYQAASLNYSTKKDASKIPTFGLEMLYRATDFTRFSFGFGAGKISVPDEPSNFYMRLSARPDIVVDIKNFSLYAGPIVGVYFIRQLDESGSVPSGETYNIRAQTKVAIAVGGQLGADFTLGRSTHVGLYLRSLLIDGAEFEGERVTPSAFAMRAPYKVRLLTVGTRFLFDF